jgi:hypothetical protein
MRIGSPAPQGSRAAQFQGPISLERALFCLGCETIFIGASRCPQCTGETVWPLTEFLFFMAVLAAEWLCPTGPSPAGRPSQWRSLATETLTDQSPLVRPAPLGTLTT